jgi:hypothetical protein
MGLNESEPVKLVRARMIPRVQIQASKRRADPFTRFDLRAVLEVEGLQSLSASAH